MSQVYPIAGDGNHLDIGSELDGTALDLNTDAGQRELWEKLVKFQPLGCGWLPCQLAYDSIIGFMPYMPLPRRHDRVDIFLGT